MMISALVFICPPKWPVVFPDRWEQPTRASGPRSKRMLMTASLAGPRSATRGLIKLPSTFPPRLPTSTKRTTASRHDTQVSVLTLEGRVIVPYTGYDQHVALIQKGAEIGAAKLWYDKPKKQFYLLVALSIETPDPHPKPTQE